MTIKQSGGIFGRNPTFNDVTIEGELTFDGDIDVNSDLKVSGDIEASRLGINTDPAHDIHIKNATAAEIKMEDTGAATAHSIIADGIGLSLRADSAYNDVINVLGGVAHQIVFRTNGADAFIVDAAGNIAFTAGKGIDFSATSGTGTSELFDDYEEGTWTPVFSDASSGGNTASGSAVGYYIKVGGLVYVTGQFENVNTTGMTGGNILYVQGIPYTPSSLPNDIFFMGSVKCDGVTNNGFVNVESVDNFAWLRFSETNNTTAGFLTVGDFASGTADIFFSLCYRSI